ncbi:MAG: hypothetical protein ACM3PU_00980 [Gemmatimonadota bacterium]
MRRPTLWLWLAMLALANPTLAAPDRSRQNFIQFCAGCHQLDGSGSPGAGIPDVRGQLGYFLNSSGGRAFLVQVPGSANSPLSDGELALLLNWMLKTFSPEQIPAPFEPYSEDEVRRLRAQVPAAIDTLRRQVTAELQRHGYQVK